MPNTSDKLRLGENHRRVVSVLLREVEKMCDAILDWLDKKPGLLLRVQDDMTAEQQAGLRKLVQQLRGEIRRFDSEVTLDPAVPSRRRAIATLLSAHRINLEEVNSGNLRGYGRLPDEVGRELDGKLGRLTTLLEAMSGVVEQR